MVDMYNTNNAVPSNDPKDLSDNSQVLDKLVNSTDATVPTRVPNVSLPTYSALAKQMAAAGGALGFANYTSLLAYTPSQANALARDNSTGIYYAWNGTQWVQATDSVLLATDLTAARSATIQELNPIRKGHASLISNRLLASYTGSTMGFTTGQIYSQGALVNNTNGKISKSLSTNLGWCWALTIQVRDPGAIVDVVTLFDANGVRQGSLFTQKLASNTTPIIAFRTPMNGFLRISCHVNEVVNLQQIPFEEYVRINMQYEYRQNTDMLSRAANTYTWQGSGTDTYPGMGIVPFESVNYVRVSTDSGATITPTKLIPAYSDVGYNNVVTTKPIAVKNGQFLQALVRANQDQCVVIQCDSSGNPIADLTTKIPYFGGGNQRLDAQSWRSSATATTGGYDTTKCDTFPGMRDEFPQQIRNMPITFDGYIMITTSLHNSDFMFTLTATALNYTSDKFGYAELDAELKYLRTPNTEQSIYEAGRVTFNTGRRSTRPVLLPKGQILRAAWTEYDVGVGISAWPVDRPTRNFVGYVQASATEPTKVLNCRVQAMNETATGPKIAFYCNDQADMWVNVTCAMQDTPSLRIVTPEQFRTERKAIMDAKLHHYAPGVVNGNLSSLGNASYVYGMCPILILNGEVAVLTSTSFRSNMDETNGYSNNKALTWAYCFGNNGVDNTTNGGYVMTSPHYANHCMLMAPFYGSTDVDANGVATATAAGLAAIQASGKFKLVIYPTYAAYKKAINNNEIVQLNPAPRWDGPKFTSQIASPSSFTSWQGNRNVTGLSPIPLPVGESVFITRQNVQAPVTAIFAYDPVAFTMTDISVASGSNDQQGYGRSVIKYTNNGNNTIFVLANTYLYGVVSENQTFDGSYTEAGNVARYDFDLDGRYDVTTATEFTLSKDPVDINFISALAYSGNLSTLGLAEISQNGKPVFVCNTALTVSGHATSGYPKKGWKFELTNANGDDISLKIGDMRMTSKLTLKAYVTEGSHSRDIPAASLWRSIRKNNIAPFNTIYDSVHAPLTNVLKKPDEAQMSSDGVPAAVYVGGAFYGMYGLRSRKDKSNYLMDTKTLTNIQLEMDDNPIYLNKAINYAQWSISSPKMKGYDDGDTPPTASVATAAERLFNWWTACEAGTTDFASTASDYLNLDSWFDYVLFAELIAHGDGVHNNIILQTWDAKHWSAAAYDMDWSLGLGVGVIGTVGNDVNANTNIMNREAFAHFYKNFLPQLKARWAKLRVGALQWDKMIKHFTEYSAKIDGDKLVKDWGMWARPYGSVTDRKAKLDYILYWLERRVAYLDRYYGYTPTGVTYATATNTITSDIADGTSASANFTVTGIKAGQDVRAVFAYDLQGGVMRAVASADNTVTLTVNNNTGATITLTNNNMYFSF